MLNCKGNKKLGSRNEKRVFFTSSTIFCQFRHNLPVEYLRMALSSWNPRPCYWFPVKNRTESMTQEVFCLGDCVEFAHIEQLKLRVERTINRYFVTNGEVEVYDGELAFPRVHQGEKGGMEDLNACECVLF